MPDQKTGNIVLTLTTDAAKGRVLTTDRAIEKGYITFAALGTTTLAGILLRVWADLRLVRYEGATDYFMATICEGYIHAQKIPIFTGRIPLYPGDSLVLAAVADIAINVMATIRFERST